MSPVWEPLDFLTFLLPLLFTDDVVLSAIPDQEHFAAKCKATGNRYLQHEGHGFELVTIACPLQARGGALPQVKEFKYFGAWHWQANWCSIFRCNKKGQSGCPWSDCTYPRLAVEDGMDWGFANHNVFPYGFTSLTLCGRFKWWQSRLSDI